MSMFGGPAGTATDDLGQAVASFPKYENAQKAVSALIAGEVPARDITIVGTGLRSMERITGRLGYATAARSGALNGLMLGLLFAFIFVLGTPNAQISAFVGVLLVGMALGMLLSLGTYSLLRRRRDFASVTQVAADHYDVFVAASSLAKARGILGTSGAIRTEVVRPPAPDAAPPQYGERVTTPGAAAPAVPPRPPVPPRPADDEPPRYGERIAPPATAPGAEAPSAPREPAPQHSSDVEPEPPASAESGEPNAEPGTPREVR
ncbi:general stress protein [Microbacterium sp. T32]|uniref:general stress protein n=1 Tax=Microbacterium sp. T32 TaxID=1776083 RepID=UPI0007AB464F|nr:general stress protein [Microbacterium sp. T32]KZE41283.1 hypothetical protein AVW09_01445 [Microbacterium sp. T32]